jgi:hypothetical protein
MNPVENSLVYAGALRKAGVPAEIRSPTAATHSDRVDRHDRWPRRG